MNRLGQNDFLGLSHQRLGWLTQLSWRKCARIDLRGLIPSGRRAAPRGASYPAVNHTGGKFCPPQGVVPEMRGERPMSINDLPVLAALRTKMQWHQERQRVLH